MPFTIDEQTTFWIGLKPRSRVICATKEESMIRGVHTMFYFGARGLSLLRP